MAARPADRIALGALDAALVLAREAGEERPALEILAGSLAEMGVRPAGMTRSGRLLTRDRDAWLMRLRSAERSASSISAYRHAIDDLISWAQQHDCTSEHVTAHTLRHTAATWLRQATGDTRLVAEYLGHSDLSAVSRYAHVASEELHTAAQALADGPDQPPPPPPPGEDPTQAAGGVHPGQLTAWE